MAFGKKKQTGSDESVGAPVQQAPMKAKKKNEMLSSVLSESVVEKLLDEFKECEFFKGEFNGETAYLGLMLAVDDIGGLSKKTNRDEDKGAIVEQIKSGRMQVLITPALLKDERMVFVPSLPTVDAMGEFGILVNAPYTLVWVTPTGDIAVTDKTVSFADIAAVYENDENAYDKFFGTGTVVNQPTFTREFDTEEPDYTGSDDDEIEEVSEEEFDEDEADASDVAEEPVYEADSVDESMDESDYESDDYSEYETEMEQTDDSNAEYDDDDYAQNGVADGDDEYYYEDDDDAEYSDESVDSTITRLFFSDDLALEVTSEPFDQQFMSQDTFVPFEENRGDGWLNGYLSQMAMNANTDLEKTHSTNMQMLRERYFRLVASYIEVIGKKLDYRNPDTKYGMAYANLVAQKAQLLNDAPAKTEQRVAECEKKWQEKLDEVGRNAATAAKAQYTERFQDMHDRDLRVIRTSVEDEINNGYQDAFRKMQTDRKADAQDLLNFSINAALTEIGDMYDKFAKAEQMKTTYGLRAIRRHTADGWHYFIVNLTPKDIAGDVTLAVPFESATWFNPMNGDIQPAEVHNGQLHIALKSGESRILQTSNQPSTNITTTASGTEEITLQGPWVLSFTDESPRVEGTFKLNKLQTWETLSDSAAVTMGTCPCVYQQSVCRLCLGRTIHSGLRQHSAQGQERDTYRGYQPACQPHCRA